MISLGTSLTLYSEGHLISALSVTGLTKQGIRRLMRNLGVPAIEFPNGRYYRHDSVVLALAAASQIGQPDFLTPGAICVHKDNRLPPIRELPPLADKEKTSLALDLIRAMHFRHGFYSDKADLIGYVRSFIDRLYREAPLITRAQRDAWRRQAELRILRDANKNRPKPVKIPSLTNPPRVPVDPTKPPGWALPEEEPTTPPAYPPYVPDDKPADSFEEYDDATGTFKPAPKPR